eukprot:CAMPEP_0113451936 /NCGR_PEP_ID=MMETSP0014_2-20120614/6591_1 /TAXON_ID=2857 /ORGANISM="Nitzschia sp." /LENGTH=944 /DNA_ID=CAMNT_0000343299 /DNA_START=332 /DNA_END=3166 /DNA_ORIENTATION=- /assembly_acc=CAM_ASM_000159
MVTEDKTTAVAESPPACTTTITGTNGDSISNSVDVLSEGSSSDSEVSNDDDAGRQQQRRKGRRQQQHQEEKTDAGLLSSSPNRALATTTTPYRRLPLPFVIVAFLACSFTSFKMGRLVVASRRAGSGLFLSSDDTRTARNVCTVSVSSTENDDNSYNGDNMTCSTTPTTTITAANTPNDVDNRDDSHQLQQQRQQQPSWKIRNKNAGNKDYRLTSEERTFNGGWHLLLELRGVDPSFLSSLSDMEESLLDVIDEMDDFEDPLHYYCHRGGSTSSRSSSTVAPETLRREQQNVVCFGLSSNKHHVSLYSWPDSGVVSVDAFAAGEDGLRDLIPEIESIFEVESGIITHESFVERKQKNHEDTTSSSGGGPTMIWQQKHRGHIEGLEETDIAALQDLYTWPIGMFVDYKVEVATVQTKFQEIKVWDVVIPSLGSVDSYKRSLSANDGSYETVHPELFLPDRIVFLDGLLQSRRSGDAPYHEALVHPLLLAHKNPKRVAIIGGGEGATLREVLKHSTIEKVVMIEIDEMMVNTSRKYLPEWNDCSNILGRSDNCFDDPHTELYCEDAFAWFKDRFSNQEDVRPEEKFDIVIMDALDPQSMQEIVGALYTDSDFYRAINNALHHDGAIVAQIGEANYLQDAPSMFSDDRNCDGFVDGLEAMNFTEMTEYQEPGCGFFDPWSFHVAAKDNSTILTEGWFANEAVVNLKIRQRILPTVDGQSSLRHFDGATMKTYRYPSKASTEVFCRDPLTPESCLEGSGFNPEISNIPVHLLQGRAESIHSSVDSPQSSFLGLETAVQAIHLDSKANEICNKTCTFDSRLCSGHPVLRYKQEYGINIGNGASLPPHPLLKPEVSEPCLRSEVTILEELGNNPKGRPIYSVLAPPFPSLPRNDTFFGSDSFFWSDYDLARRRQPPSHATIKRTAHGISKDKPVTKASVCSLTRQHFALE